MVKDCARAVEHGVTLCKAESCSRPVSTLPPLATGCAGAKEGCLTPTRVQHNKVEWRYTWDSPGYLDDRPQ